MSPSLSTGIQLPRADVAHLRAEFAARNCIVLSHLLAPNTQQQLLQQLAKAHFVAKTHHTAAAAEFAKDVTIVGDALALHHLHLLFNHPQLFAFVQAVTGCPTIGCVYGRIYRTLPNADHHLDWHDDTHDADTHDDDTPDDDTPNDDTEEGSGTRLIGLSVNLSPEAYGGGHFQLRKKGSTALLADVTHACVGDAHLFRIGRDLEHCLTPVTGTVARTAAAGWFLDQPQALGLLKSFAVKGQRRIIHTAVQKEFAL